MPRRRNLGFILLLYWSLHADFTVSTPPRFVDTLQSFTDPDGIFLEYVIVDHNTSDVYVAGYNVLYHLSSDLEMMQRVTTGPLEDAGNCLIPPYPCDIGRTLHNNQNHLLQMINFLGSPPKLLLCGTVYNGLCQVRSTDNLDEVHWVHPHNSSLGFNRGADTNKAMFLRGHNGQWTLFTHLVELDEDESLPVLTSKVLVKEKDDYYFRYPLPNDSTSSQFMAMDTRVGDAVIEGFVHDEYAYFLTTISRSTDNWQTKLVRFCPEDATFRSYAELTLMCQHDTSYRANPSGGHYGDTPSSTEKSLYVSFSTKGAYGQGSVVCAYPMATIIGAFDKVPRDCSWETFGEKCDTEDKKDNVSFCGGSIDKPYIISRPLIVQHFGVIHYRVIAFTTVKQNNDVVVIGIGRYGRVCKMKVSTGEIFAINKMAEEKLSYYGSFIVDRESDNIYLQVRDQIFKYPVASCAVHETYTLCLTNGQKDPLRCGWCEGRCTTQEECPHPGSFYREIFEKPKLYGIRPHKGPTSGGTELTLFGENLGYSIEKDRMFSVEKRVCKITEVDENTASCITGNSTFFRNDFPESIALLIGNEIYGIDTNSSWEYNNVTNGSFPSDYNITDLSQSFEYTPDPVINQLQPGFTTISGLLNVTATGLHLDSVQFPKLVVKISITPPTDDLKNLEILEDCWSDPESNGTTMTCRTPPLPKRQGVAIPTSTNPLLTHVAFMMDGVQKLKDFNIQQEEKSLLLYYPDPVYEEVSKTGDKTLVIKGNHLYLINLSGSRIRLGSDYFCNIVSFSEKYITCDIPPALLSHSPFFGTNITVEVFIGYIWHQIGYIEIETPEEETHETSTIESATNLNPNWWIVIALILVCVIVIACTGFKYWQKKSHKPSHTLDVANPAYTSEIIDDYLRMATSAGFIQSYASAEQSESAGNQSAEALLADSEIMALLGEKDLVIPKSWLVVGEKVGAGQFGCVFEGLLQRPEELKMEKVAIKTLHEHSWSNLQTVESFLKEALIMKDFRHPNVLSLLGVCFEGSAPSIVLPFMENGDLCSYIRDKTKAVLVTNLLKFAIDVASGMAYLAKMKFVHRDLAARNCILDSALGVKVADFGLSRDVYTGDYYRCQDRTAKLPCRWMAPESLEDQVYSTKTDVWSYGVLVWELLTRGNLPYPNVTNWDVLEFIKSGNRLDQPEHCPKSVYMVMLACWNKESKKRPSFSLIHEYVKRIRQGILEKQQKKSPSDKVPAQHTGYYNSRELYLRMDGLVLNKEILKESNNVQNEYIDMSKKKETSV